MVTPPSRFAKGAKLQMISSKRRWRSLSIGRGPSVPDGNIGCAIVYTSLNVADHGTPDESLRNMCVIRRLQASSIRHLFAVLRQREMRGAYSREEAEIAKRGKRAITWKRRVVEKPKSHWHKASGDVPHWRCRTIIRPGSDRSDPPRSH